METLLVEPFQQAHLRVVSFDDSSRRKEFLQNLAEFAFPLFGGLAERLNHQVIGVTVNDERGNSVTASEKQAVDFGILNHTFAVFGGGLNATGEIGAVDSDVFARDQANGDLRTVAIKRTAQKPAAIVHQAHQIARTCIRPANIAAINPEMTGLKPLRPPLAYDHL